MYVGVTDWASLRDAYGSAADVPALLAAAEAAAADEGGVWDELWARLHHQGTVYSASYAALPVLAGISRQHPPSGYVAALQLAAVILASRGPEDHAVVRRRYENDVADLHAAATASLPYANDDADFVYGLQALMAFEDGGVWQRNLHCLADGEVEIDCPSCDEHLLVDLDDTQVTVESFLDGSLPATAVTPLAPAATTVEGRLLALALGHGRPGLAEKLPYLFGTATCPRCHTSIDLPRVLA